jgi:hypothetical protein
MAESPNSSMTNEQKNAVAAPSPASRKMRPPGTRIQADEIIVFDEADVDFDSGRICRNAGS